MATFKLSSGDDARDLGSEILNDGEEILICIGSTQYAIYHERGSLGIRLTDIGATGNHAILVKPVAANVIELKGGR